MKFRALLIAVVTSIGLIVTSSASAAVVGGIFFEDNGTGEHFENTTLYETVVSAPGDTLTGYGFITSVNGNDPSIYGGGLYRLYFTFSYNVLAITGNIVQFDNGVVDIYRLDSSVNLFVTAPATAIGLIEAGTEWLRLVGHDNIADFSTGGLPLNPNTELYGEGVTLGDELAFQGKGLLDVELGWGIAAVEAFLDTNSVADNAGGWADMEITTIGSSLSPAPGADCTPVNGQLPSGEFCISGSANIKGAIAAVPEPATLALLGIALVGLGATTGRRNRAK